MLLHDFDEMRAHMESEWFNVFPVPSYALSPGEHAAHVHRRSGGVVSTVTFANCAVADSVSMDVGEQAAAASSMVLGDDEPHQYDSDSSDSSQEIVANSGLGDPVPKSQPLEVYHDFRLELRVQGTDWYVEFDAQAPKLRTGDRFLVEAGAVVLIDTILDEFQQLTTNTSILIPPAEMGKLPRGTHPVVAKVQRSDGAGTHEVATSTTNMPFYGRTTTPDSKMLGYFGKYGRFNNQRYYFYQALRMSQILDRCLLRNPFRAQYEHTRAEVEGGVLPENYFNFSIAMDRFPICNANMAISEGCVNPCPRALWSARLCMLPAATRGDAAHDVALAS